MEMENGGVSNRALNFSIEIQRKKKSNEKLKKTMKKLN